MAKNLPASAGDARDKGLISGWERSPGVGMATYSSILAWKIPGQRRSLVGRGAWWATICEATKSWTCLRIHTHKVNVNPGLLNNLFNKLFSNLSASSPEKYCQLNY